MAKKNTSKDLWLIKPDIKKAKDKQCVAEAWVLTGNAKSLFGCKDAEIKAMLFWQDANIRIESKTQPKINLDGNEDIFTWKTKIIDTEFLGKSNLNIEFSDAMPDEIKNNLKGKISKDPRTIIEFLVDNGWKQHEYSVWILSPLIMEKLESQENSEEWDYKCLKKTCGWTGTVDECDFDDDGNISCPNCGNNKLQMKD